MLFVIVVAWSPNWPLGYGRSIYSSSLSLPSRWIVRSSASWAAIIECVPDQVSRESRFTYVSLSVKLFKLVFVMLSCAVEVIVNQWLTPHTHAHVRAQMRRTTRMFKASYMMTTTLSALKNLNRRGWWREGCQGIVGRGRGKESRCNKHNQHCWGIEQIDRWR